jgi:phage terminase small subunit
MARATLEQQDKFADELAAGLPICRAAENAGYKPKSEAAHNLAKEPEFMAKVEKRRRARTPAANPDLEPIIERLLAAADKAGAMGSAAAMRATCELLTEAARLKQLLPPEETAPANHEMTREEWLAAFAPK